MIAFFARLFCGSRGFSVASRVSADDRSLRESAFVHLHLHLRLVKTTILRPAIFPQRLIANFSLFLPDTIAQSYNKDNKLHLSASSVT